MSSTWDWVFVGLFFCSMFWSRSVCAPSNLGMLQDITTQGKGDKRKRSSDLGYAWARSLLFFLQSPFHFNKSYEISHCMVLVVLVVSYHFLPLISTSIPYACPWTLLLWSANPVPFVQQRIQCVTVCLVVMMSSSTSSLTIVILPCCHSRITLSLAWALKQRGILSGFRKSILKTLLSPSRKNNTII